MSQRLIIHVAKLSEEKEKQELLKPRRIRLIRLTQVKAPRSFTDDKMISVRVSVLNNSLSQAVRNTYSNFALFLSNALLDSDKSLLTSSAASNSISYRAAFTMFDNAVINVMAKRSAHSSALPSV